MHVAFLILMLSFSALLWAYGYFRTPCFFLRWLCVMSPNGYEVSAVRYSHGLSLESLELPYISLLKLCTPFVRKTSPQKFLLCKFKVWGKEASLLISIYSYLMSVSLCSLCTNLNIHVTSFLQPECYSLLLVSISHLAINFMVFIPIFISYICL